MKPPALRTLLIDRDDAVVTWWHRQNGRWSIDHRQDRRGFQELLSSLVDDDDAVPARWSTAAIVADGISFVEAAAERGCPELLIYADPPYMAETRSKLNLYRFEMTDRDHIRFLKAAKRLSGPTVISGYDSRAYRKYLDGWSVDTRQVITRGRTLATECVWRNAPAKLLASSSVAMEYSQLAGNFRDRQRVDRLCKRWVADFQRKPTQERRAILLALLDAERSAAAIVGHNDDSHHHSSESTMVDRCNSSCNKLRVESRFEGLDRQP